MKMYKAEIIDILRANQRDSDFINELQEYVGDLLKLVVGKNYNRWRRFVPIATSAWYYLLTSVSNLQTLGEEYTGIIRVNSKQKLVSQFGHIFWLLLHVGGAGMFDRSLVLFGNQITKNSELTNEARHVLLNAIDFLKENKYIFLRIHQTIFFIYGTYHNFANRFSGIRFVLLRQWMRDSTATKSFHVLGYISMLYLIYLLVDKLAQSTKSSSTPFTIASTQSTAKVCPLCGENCKNVCATFCGHLFCWECIYKSMKFQPNCPVCREHLKPSRIIPLQNF